MIGVAYLTGFRPDAGGAEWLAVAGMLLLWVLALSWVAVCFGLLARTVEGANGFTSWCCSCRTCPARSCRPRR